MLLSVHFVKNVYLLKLVQKFIINHLIIQRLAIFIFEKFSGSADLTLKIFW